MGKHKTTLKEYVSLKTHFDALRKADTLRYRELRKSDRLAIKAAMDASEKAVSKSEAANSRRFENTNEWRETYGDLANRGRGAAQFVIAAFAALGVIVAAIAFIISLVKP